MSRKSIGSKIYTANASFDVAYLLAWTLVAIVFAFVLEAVVSIFKNLGENKMKDIIFKNTFSFSYPDKEIYKNFNAVFLGDKINVVLGASGVGKNHSSERSYGAFRF
ncbi:MAG: hypothetical protein L6V85_07510 [Clostridiales bacterium]|nr:MAG: hypothetical protein L6V85_07510 [Clostridiales bacterium]